MTPQEYIFICVTGLTPQVVTETVYALGATAGDDGEIALPTEIHVISTKTGKERVEATLLGEAGQLARLCRDYGWDRTRIALDSDHIHVISDAAGRELDDIRDEHDNAAAADFITRFICRAANGPVRLHVSIAGGRKTMGYFCGYALSLYGHPEDRLSHVLVNPPFESHPDFFYPPPVPVRLTTTDGSTVSTADACVSLANIPFVRLRQGVDEDLLEGGLSFSESVARAQQTLDAPELHIDLTNRKVLLQGHRVRLSDTNFLWLTWFAERAQRKLPPIAFDEQAGRDLLRIVTWLEGAGASRLRESVEEALAELGRGDKQYFERNRSRLNKALYERSDLCAAAARRYELKSLGRRPHTKYGLTLSPDTIRIEGTP